MQNKYLRFILLTLLCGQLWVGTVMAEPLRLLVPVFFGPAPLNQFVSTTIYLEMIQALRSVDPVQKGAWILYGQENLPMPTHDEILTAASWPSVRADLVVWGQIYQFDDGVVVQPYLTLTSLLKNRQVRPEIWTLFLKDLAGESVQLELDIPGQFYHFEPLLLSREAIVAFKQPHGMPLYATRHGGKVIGELGEVMEFIEIHDDAMLISSNNLHGWLRITSLSQQRSEAIDFSKGMVRLLRGDWVGAQQSFTEVLKNSSLPQGLRIHALIYSGLAKEKTGSSGQNEFEKAHFLNQLDKDAAAYLLMSQASKIARLQKKGTREQLFRAQQRLQTTFDANKILFAADDPWLAKLQLLIRSPNN